MGPRTSATAGTAGPSPGAGSNLSGGLAKGAGNLISGNGQDGVEIVGSAATGNRLAGNLIGTDATGNKALGNASDGVSVNRAPSNTIGSTSPSAGNVIAGNG